MVTKDKASRPGQTVTHVSQPLTPRLPRFPIKLWISLKGSHFCLLDPALCGFGMEGDRVPPFV